MLNNQDDPQYQGQQPWQEQGSKSAQYAAEPGTCTTG